MHFALHSGKIGGATGELPIWLYEVQHHSKFHEQDGGNMMRVRGTIDKQGKEQQKCYVG